MRAIRKIVVTGAAVAALSLVGTALAVSPAHADPSPLPPWPSLTDIVGVGSDTITPLFDAETSAYNSTDPTDNWYSWDAVNPTTGAVGDEIITKTSDPNDNPPTDLTCQIPRPDGSSQGISALENNTQDGTAYCIDYARSSRPPETSDPNTIAFDSLAEDAITWATPAGTSSDPSPVPSTLTLQDLVNIYECNDTNWDQVGGSDAAITPVLPQSGSGTRASFLLMLGAIAGDAPGTQLAFGSCVVNGESSEGNPIEENTGVTTGDEQVYGTTTSPNVGVIAPYSIGDYIAQTGQGNSTSVWQPGPLVVEPLTDDSGNVQAPITGTGTGEVINVNFPEEMWRTLYVVVRNAGTTAAPAIPSYLDTIFGSSGWFCTSTTAQSILTSYGFSSLGGGCGSVTDESLYYGS
jgi:ABC-type phosphate transport system substrate-binding protein